MRLSFVVSLSIRLQTSIWEPHPPNGRHEDVKRTFHQPKDDPPLLAWGAGAARCTGGVKGRAQGPGGEPDFDADITSSLKSTEGTGS